MFVGVGILHVGEHDHSPGTEFFAKLFSQPVTSESPTKCYPDLVP